MQELLSASRLTYLTCCQLLKSFHLIVRLHQILLQRVTTFIMRHCHAHEPNEMSPPSAQSHRQILKVFVQIFVRTLPKIDRVIYNRSNLIFHK